MLNLSCGISPAILDLQSTKVHMFGKELDRMSQVVSDYNKFKHFPYMIIC
jgi:hypothetical protein